MSVSLYRWSRRLLTPKTGPAEMGHFALSSLLTVFLYFSSLDYIYADTNGTYLVSLPAELHGGTKEKFCITFFDIKVDVNIIVVIHNEDNSWNFNKRDKFLKGECRCAEIDVPEVYMEGFYIMTIWGFQEDQTLLFSQTMDRVKIVNNNTLIFIQADKYLYVPGQIVKFRILTTNINLKSKAGMISEVAIINPFGIKMKKWADVANMQGLMSFNFQLAPQPVLGKWRIEVADGNKVTESEFEVQKYVLPRFEVSIEVPPYILLNVPEIKIKICANHPQGKEIHGSLTSKVCVYTSDGVDDGRPCANYTAEICGCHNFTVDSAAIGLSLQKYSLKNALLEVFASVTDYDSRISVNSTIYGPEIKNEHVIIDLQASEYFFKPGFLYYGKANVYKPDYSVAPGEIVEISAIDYVNDVRLSKNFTSDKNGIITFTMNQFDSRTEQFNIEARSINGTLSFNDDHHMMYTPIDQKRIKQWYSPGQKYLKILPIDDVQSCRKNLNVKLLYTGTRREKIRIHYLVLSKSQIVANGQMSYRVDHHHTYKEQSPPDLLDTIVNNLEDLDAERSKSLSNQVPTPTSSIPEVIQKDFMNITDTKSDDLDSNVVEDEDGKKNKKKKRKKKKNKERRPRATKDQFIAELNLHLRIIPEMSPLSYITIYLLNEDTGELISDYQEFTIKTCFKNQVGLLIPQKTMYPGDKIDFRLHGSLRSYCALNLVDLSTFPGWSNWITKEQVFKKLKEYHFQYDKQAPVPDKYCQNVLLEQQHGIVSSDYRGRRSSSVFSSKYVDAIYAFQASGVLVLTDIDLESRPCSWLESAPGTLESTDELWGQFYNIPESTDERKIEDTFLPEERYGILDYFPEPWLWKHTEIKRNDSVLISTNVPYPANEWTGNVFCASETDGLGLFSLPVITIFQPFSVSYVVPYTCIAGERIPVSITVESNVKSCLSLQLYVEKQMISKNESQMIEGPQLCLCNEEFLTNEVHLDKLIPGSINLTVLAVVIETPNGKCTPETIEREYFGKTDVSNAIIEVLAPGFQQEIVHSEYVCPRENEDGLYVYSVTSKVPSDVIPDSVKAEVFVFGNMLWPGIQKLDNLMIKEPISNGEGNILSFAIVICVMDYLNAVGLVSFEIESAAMRLMEKSYQQQMNYIHDDGSYSIFGIQDEEGSEILTAFVIQILVKARSYIYIDDRNLQKSIAWLRAQQQQDDGCFFDKGESYKKSKYEKDTTKLRVIHTAKILVSLLEFGTPHYDPLVDMGFKCLVEHEPEDMYMLSLYAYAFSLYGLDEQETDKYRRELESKSISNGNNKYWMELNKVDKDSAATSLDIETTSYALLALLGNEVVSSWQDLKPIIHWLSEQRKPMKGFIASKGSMIAFQAITNYALMWTQRQEVPDVDVKIIDGGDLKKTYKLSEKNIFDLLTYTTDSIRNKIRVEADGYGCGMIQTSLTYNMHTVTQIQSFYLHVANHHDHSNCAETKVQICCRYTGNDERTNVVIMEVKMVTGWIPRQILGPKHLKDIGVKKHEMTEDYVYLYFDEMNKTEKCVTIKMEQVLSVSAKPATIFVYDYYDKEVVGRSQYRLKRKCQTKEELPDISEEEYLTSMTQARRPPPKFPGFVNKVKISPNSTATESVVSEMADSAERKPTFPPDDTQEECPKCLTKIPDEYHNLFCRATEVYKVGTGKEKGQEKNLLKIVADLRPQKKLSIDKHIVPVLKDFCNCPALKEKGRHILVRLKSGPQFQELDKMLFNNQIILFPFTPTVEKKMRQLAKSCTR